MHCYNFSRTVYEDCPSVVGHSKWQECFELCFRKGAVSLIKDPSNVLCSHFFYENSTKSLLYKRTIPPFSVRK